MRRLAYFVYIESLKGLLTLTRSAIYHTCIKLLEINNWLLFPGLSAICFPSLITALKKGRNNVFSSEGPNWVCDIQFWRIRLHSFHVYFACVTLLFRNYRTRSHANLCRHWNTRHCVHTEIILIWRAFRFSFERSSGSLSVLRRLVPATGNELYAVPRGFGQSYQ